MSQQYLEIKIPEYIIKILDSCQTSNGNFNFQKFNNIKTPEIDFFLEEINVTSTELFNIHKHNLPGIPLCHTCGKRLKLIGGRLVKYCSRKCQSLNPENRKMVTETWKNKDKSEINSMVNKIKKTCLEKYGTEAYCQTDEWKKKYRNSCLEKYGVEGYSQSEEWRKSVEETWKNKPQSEIDKKNEKARKTSIEKYGVEWISQTDEWKNKVKQTNLERYGVENPLQNPEINEKRRKTFLDRYSDNSIITDKIRKTNLEKYGVEWISQTDEWRKSVEETWNNKTQEEIEEHSLKIKKSNLDRYGVESYSQTDEWKDKVKITSLEKYGTDFPFQSNELKEKYKQACIEKYGVEWASQSDTVKLKILKNKRLKNYQSNKDKLALKGIEIISGIDSYVNNSLVDYRCGICGTEFQSKYTSFQKVICPECSKLIGKSEDENILTTYISEICDYQIIRNDRTILDGKELDIYIPEKHLAIEFNGDYWHSDNKVGKKYHQEKSLKCMEKGIRLIHIFEYEWNNKQEICKSIIKSALGIYDKTIYARRCVVKEINSDNYRNFLDINHLQGAINSSIRYGLYYQNELVSVIGFGKSRFKQGEIELHRFCSKLGYHIPGAFSKLIKHSGLTDFITYVDLAHFSGDGYKALGFKELSITEPNYKWVKGNIALNRFQTQKHKLNNLLYSYNGLLTEDENMSMNGFFKIYDSGNLKLEYCYRNLYFRQI